MSSDQSATSHEAPVDLLVAGADLVATMDVGRREIAGGWVAVTDGRVVGIGGPGAEPRAREVLRADGCLVTPGLVNTHHHIYQNLTRSFAPALGGDLFDWLRTLYPVWSRLDEEAAYVSAWIGLAELALGGCNHHHRPPVRAPPGRRRPDRRGDRCGERARHAVPPDAGLDEPVGEGRWAAARLGGAGRRRDPRRQRAARAAPPRPVARGDGAHRACSVRRSP
ncbi:MAG: hypothetical protein R2713_19865 [Ilumatobacteraceae bacterium]